MTDTCKPVSAGFGIYIHIPFCKKKCNYCDFLSFLLPCEDRVADYVLGLKKEMELVAPLVKDSEAVSVYFGGGTPSLLSSQNLRDIMSAVEKHFSFSPYMEITLEANPGTLSREKLRDMVSIGINRLSLGVQSLEDRLLCTMGRLHNAREATEAFCLAREEGMGNINIDLIHGLPGQTLRDWENTLRSVIDLGPDHVSAYGLSLGENTAWGRLYSKGALALPCEDECAVMYHMTQEILSRAGYLQYEISNYAKPGFECRHNIGYWHRRHYIGLGLGASSFIEGARYRNYGDLSSYLDALARGKIPFSQKEMISRGGAMSETMFLGLRTSRGVNFREFEWEFGVSVEEAYPDTVQLEKTGVLMRDGSQLRLNPDFYAVSNEVFVKFV